MPGQPGRSREGLSAGCPSFLPMILSAHWFMFALTVACLRTSCCRLVSAMPPKRGARDAAGAARAAKKPRASAAAVEKAAGKQAAGVVDIEDCNFTAEGVAQARVPCALLPALLVYARAGATIAAITYQRRAWSCGGGRNRLHSPSRPHYQPPAWSMTNHSHRPQPITHQPQVRSALLAWYDRSHRVLPWRRNPHSQLEAEEAAGAPYDPAPLDLPLNQFIYCERAGRLCFPGHRPRRADSNAPEIRGMHIVAQRRGGSEGRGCALHMQRRALCAFASLLCALCHAVRCAAAAAAFRRRRVGVRDHVPADAGAQAVCFLPSFSLPRLSAAMQGRPPEEHQCNQ